jgi:hypothetical protein
VLGFLKLYKFSVTVLGFLKLYKFSALAYIKTSPVNTGRFTIEHMNSFFSPLEQRRRTACHFIKRGSYKMYGEKRGRHQEVSLYKNPTHTTCLTSL